MENVAEGLTRVGERLWMIDTAFFPILRDSNDEELRLCPCCEHLGEPNSRATFYWSTVKLSGICHRCHSIFIPLSDKTPEQIQLELAVRGLVKTHSTESYRKMSTVPAINYTQLFNPLSDYGKEYIRNRNPLLQGLEDILEMRELPDVGIAVPMYFKDRIISYTMRLYNPTTRMKYFIPPGDKYLYSPFKSLKGIGSIDKFSLCEGFFDCLAMAFMGFNNPMSVQGSFLTLTQARMISQFFPSECLCYLDKTELSEQLKRSVINNVKCISKVSVVRSVGFDPEETLMWRLANWDLEYAESVLSNRDKLIERLGNGI